MDNFRIAGRLVVAYVAVAALTLVAALLLRNHHGLVNSAVWTRGVIVLASSLLTLVFLRGAAAGGRRAYLRLRIITVVMPVAIAVIVLLPGLFPLWMKIDQIVCGLLLVAVAVLVNAGHVRTAMAPSSS